MNRTELNGTIRNIPEKYDENGNIIEDKKEYNEKDLILKHVVPLSFSFVSDDIGSFAVICLSESDELFTICTNYQFEEEIEKSVMKELPFYDDNKFPNHKIVDGMIINKIPSFLTDFKFTYHKEEEIYKFTLKARELTKEGAGREVEFKCTSDIYCSLKFFDQYIFNCIINNHDITAATISGFAKEDPSEVFIVDRVDRIVAMAPMEIEGVKHSTNIALEFVVAKMNFKTESFVKSTILATFDIGQEFKKKKFKGMTVDKLNDTFFAEDDQYLQMYNTFDRLENIDKEYLIIRATNKDQNSKIFFIDSTIRTELETMIGEF